MTLLRVPTICLVTDRRRLVPPTDDELVRLTQSAAAAGVDLIQVRERDLHDRDLLSLSRRIVGVSAGTRVEVVVNDRVDIALAAGSGGVHLRADSVGPDRVRAVAPHPFIIGRSVHSVAEARAAAGTGVDYLVMGTVYPSKSKNGSVSIVGIAALEAVCRTVSIPVLAIGGITTENVGEVAAAGASGIAAIGLFSDALADRGEDLDAALSALVTAISRAFARFSSAS